MDYIGLGLLIAAFALFAFLAYRAFRARRRWVKVVGGIPAALLALLFGAAATLAFAGYSKLNAARPNPTPQLTAQLTPQRVANGERFARTCAGCHSSSGQLPLAGQNFFAANDSPPMGVVWAPNLTPAHLKDWSDGEIVRAIREGIGRDGRSLLIMPSAAFHSMSDEDVLSIVAYLRSQPPIEPNSPPKRLNVLGAIMFATILPDEVLSAQPPISAPQVAPPRGPTAAYGGYLIRLGCQECHGANLAGTPPGGDGPPASPNLTTVSRRITADQFVTLLRTGVYPDGHKLSGEMPWKDLEKFSDDDFRALYAHLATLQPLPDNR